MEKFLIILFAIFEYIFYTFFMVLIEEIMIDNAILKLIIHFSSLTIISIVLYYIIRFLLDKLKLKSKKYIYKICIWNLIIGIVFPLLLIIIIPNENFTLFAFILIISTCYYGIFINLLLCILNYFLTNRKKLG